jgi:hypothetical protein
VFFVDGPGGTGKTSLFNSILRTVRGDSNTALAVASSVIASLLMIGVQTSHSMFKIPREIHSLSYCNIPVDSPTAKLIQMGEVIIWDEDSMTSRHIFHAVNRTFQDIMGDLDPALEEASFGGRVVVSGDDFCQLYL